MLKKFKRHIEKQFLFYPNTKELREMKEELLGTLMDEFKELVDGGMSEEDAYAKCIADMDDYRDSVREMMLKNIASPTKASRKLVISGVITYILGITLLYFILSFTCVSWAWSWLTFVAGFAVGLTVIFARVAVLAFRHSKYSLIRFISVVAIFYLTLAVYLAVSLALGNMWHITWLTFIVGFTLAYIVDIIYTAKQKVKRLYPLDILIISLMLTIIVYFIISFVLQAWSSTWMLFIAWTFIAAFAIFVYRYIKYRNHDDNLSIKKSESIDTLPVDDDCKNDKEDS